MKKILLGEPLCNVAHTDCVLTLGEGTRSFRKDEATRDREFRGNVQSICDAVPNTIPSVHRTQADAQYGVEVAFRRPLRAGG